jgi:hypothetical protein
MSIASQYRNKDSSEIMVTIQLVFHIISWFSITIAWIFFENIIIKKINKFEANENYSSIEYYTLMITNLPEDCKIEEAKMKFRLGNSEIDIYDINFCYDVKKLIDLQKKSKFSYFIFRKYHRTENCIPNEG